MVRPLMSSTFIKRAAQEMTSANTRSGGEVPRRAWPKGLLTRGQGKLFQCWFLAIEGSEEKQLRLFKIFNVSTKQLSLFRGTSGSSVFVRADGMAMPIDDDKEYEEFFAEVGRAWAESMEFSSIMKMQFGQDSVWTRWTTWIENDKWLNILKSWEEGCNRKNGEFCGREEDARPPEKFKDEDRE